MGPKSGYDIKKESEHSIGYFWSESYGSIYPILKQLEAEGLVIKKRGGDTGGRHRYIYVITEPGLAELREWLRRPVETGVLREELLLKIFFGGQTTREKQIEHVEECRTQNEKKLKELERLDNLISTKRADHPDLPLWRITINMGRHRARAYISWCEETLKRLRA